MNNNSFVSSLRLSVARSALHVVPHNTADDDRLQRVALLPRPASPAGGAPDVRADVILRSVVVVWVVGGTLVDCVEDCRHGGVADTVVEAAARLSEGGQGG